mmetsp:Transcript_40397/g.93725  ORF Transcript_40397/g.93725 Transcript_40397/m.93725 type:complete len:271 (+) Transcript_40397:51-863(+)
MLRGLASVARRLRGPTRPSIVHQILPRRYSSDAEELVSVHCIAVYIQEQINGSLNDIFEQISQRVDTLEIPNKGSATRVRKDDACLIMEDIGADPCDLDAWLATYPSRDRSIELWTPSDLISDPDGLCRLPHPRHATHGFSKTTISSVDVHENSWKEDLEVEEIRAKSKRESLGLWFKQSHSMAYVVYARNATYNLARRNMDPSELPAFNTWCRTHMSPGWVACGGACKGQKTLQWFKVSVEGRPFLNRELERKNCMGYCREARRAELKG